MCREQRQRQAIDAERNAAGMREFAAFSFQVPRRTEMITVIVEAQE
jgi:hypothetical protein